ncbi:MAG: hypothetical protein Q4G50_13525 [Corynebacterium sp.]|nr:hypothetical protein [Corynebacterium sp.]MDO5671005.1 hypothetical protein [Corynebacterium sp.]
MLRIGPLPGCVGLGGPHVQHVPGLSSLIDDPALSTRSSLSSSD